MWITQALKVLTILLEVFAAVKRFLVDVEPIIINGIKYSSEKEYKTRMRAKYNRMWVDLKGQEGSLEEAMYNQSLNEGRLDLQTN